MAPKQKTKESNSNPWKTTLPQKSKKIPSADSESTSNSNPSKSKPWTSLSPAEKTSWATQLFLTSGAWKNWPEGVQKEFLKSVEQGKEYPGSSATIGRADLEALGRDRNGKRIADYTGEELEIWRERKRELVDLKRESWEFRERAFLSRKGREGRVKIEEENLVVEISSAEIEEERKRRKRMAVLEGRMEKDVGRYSGDPLWDDVVPLVQEESLGALASIAYTEEYAEATSYLRAVMSTSEHSPRILSLTSHIISLNPAHYTVWLYRAQTLFALDASLTNELEWLNQIALENQKNYQIWHHRQLLIDHLYPKQDYSVNTKREEKQQNEEREKAEKEELIKKEFQFMSQMLSEDSKNYHVWSYRQWFIRHLSLFSSPTELEYTNTLIHQDLRNNSAYSHRFFLVFNNPEYCTPDSKPTQRDYALGAGRGKEVVEREIEWVKGWILSAPQNGSAWGYLRGVLRKGGVGFGRLACFAGNFVVLGDGDGGDDDGEAGSGKVGVGVKEDIKSSHALEFLADVWSGAEESVDGGADDGKKDLRKADRAFRLLGEKYDVIRRNYWEWRREGLRGV